MSDKLEFHGEEPPELKSEVPKLTAKETADMMARLEAARLAAKREPLLSDTEIESMVKSKSLDQWSIQEARDFYEGLIASGELITKEEHERLVKQAIKDHIRNEAEEE